MNDVEASITLGIVSLLFWFVLFLAEIPAKEAGTGKG
jgi:hypothetical protein